MTIEQQLNFDVIKDEIKEILNKAYLFPEDIEEIKELANAYIGYHTVLYKTDVDYAKKHKDLRYGRIQ
jgi:hypothetical protein